VSNDLRVRRRPGRGRVAQHEAHAAPAPGRAEAEEELAVDETLARRS
jgi:hypothetical protein